MWENGHRRKRKRKNREREKERRGGQGEIAGKVLEFAVFKILTSLFASCFYNLIQCDCDVGKASFTDTNGISLGYTPYVHV